MKIHSVLEDKISFKSMRFTFIFILGIILCTIIGLIINMDLLFLIIGIILTIHGLSIMYASLAFVYYFFVKKVVPKNKILRYLIWFSQEEYNNPRSFEEIRWHKASRKIIDAISVILIGIILLYFGLNFIFPTRKFFEELSKIGL